MIVFRALAVLADFAVELVRPHRCRMRGGCGFRTQRIELLVQHYETNHAGEQMTATSKGCAR